MASGNIEGWCTWKTHPTKVTYQGYLNKWILRWKNYTLSAINAGEVELWAQVRMIEIDFPAQHRDLEERRRFVGELCGRTDWSVASSRWR